MWPLYLVLIALAIFVAVIAFRTMAFRPKPADKAVVTPQTFDGERAVKHLQEVIRCKTVSFMDKSLEDEAAFEALEKLLPTLYPHVYQACTFEKIGPRALLFHWKGKSAAKPSVLMAHYDVVPVNASMWQKPAFDATIEKGEMWGRGTLDTKSTFVGVLEAADTMIERGYMPQNDIYLAFAGDEEIGGPGAPSIVETFKKRGISPAFVLDEGGAVVQNVFPGVSKPCALVGIGEKGSMIVNFAVDSKGGHASSPPPHTPVGVLSKAVTRIENAPFPFRLTPPAKEMFDTLARHSGLLYRVIFSNLWCFQPLLNLICKKSGGEMNALVRTTCAFTQMSGSAASNVLPPSASVGANVRLVGGDTIDSATEYIKRIVNDSEVKVTVTPSMNPSPYSRTDDEPWRRLTQCIRASWPDALVSPYLMIACSDSRHYAGISDHVYRFSGMALTSEQRSSIHANNERIPVETVKKTVEFYLRVIQSC